MRGVFNRLMAILTGFAFIIAMSVQAAPPAQTLHLATPGTKADMPCPRMTADRGDPSAPRQMPCKGIMLDCVKQMGCVGSPNLPSRSAELRTPVSYSRVTYWLPAEESAGLSIAPDLLPPRAG